MTFDIHTLFGPGEFLGLLFCTILMLAGVLTSWLTKWANGELGKVSLIGYLFHDNIQGTVKSVLSSSSIFYGAWFSGFFDGSTARVVLVAAFAAGYGLDLALNKGKKPETKADGTP